MKRYLTAGFLGIVIAIILAGGYSAISFALKNKTLVRQHELTQPFIPMYHSVRKIPDFFFIPLSIFTKSDLAEYDIRIPNDNIEKMNSHLSDEPFTGYLSEENKLWVNAKFRSGDYADSIKIRYRGNVSNHWNSYKKSYSIKFPKDNLFQGMRQMTLVIPDDRLYFTASLNNYRGRKMGLSMPNEFYVTAEINGADKGVYLAYENWSQEWVEKHPISPLSTLYGLNDLDNFSRAADEVPFSIYSKEALNYWKSWNSEELYFPEIETLIALVRNTTDEEFERLAPTLIDLEAFYAQDTINILAGGYHLSDAGNNIILLFDRTEGRFKPIPFNAALYKTPEVTDAIAAYAPLLQKRIWSIPSFQEDFKIFFENYVIKNQEDDLAFLDNWIKTLKFDFLRDTAKLYNNFHFLNEIKELQSFVAQNFSLTPQILGQYDIENRLAIPENVTFQPEFKYLKDSAFTTTEFLKINPQFELQDENLILRSGIHHIKKTIIIPRGTNLTIESGAQIKLNPSVSIVSYSPVHVIGNEKNPVSFEPMDKNAQWGVFAVLNTESATSTLQHAIFSGGNEDTINGAYISGAVSFHNANVVIRDSAFKEITSEDAINVKGGLTIIQNNIIDNTVSDGIDLDYVDEKSRIAENNFENIGGDAIDISWTNAKIENNIITKCIDKGISIGERSEPTISNNTISLCAIGIAVKDQSDPLIKNNTLLENTTGVSLYQKKIFFGGATATLSNNIFEANKNDTQADEYSLITREE